MLSSITFSGSCIKLLAQLTMRTTPKTNKKGREVHVTLSLTASFYVRKESLWSCRYIKALLPVTILWPPREKFVSWISCALQCAHTHVINTEVYVSTVFSASVFPSLKDARTWFLGKAFPLENRYVLFPAAYPEAYQPPCMLQSGERTQKFRGLLSRGSSKLVKQQEWFFI